MNSAKKKIAVLTGAGVSAESGLSTFRGNNGLWGEYDPEEVASIQGWYRNRELVLNFYNGLRKRLSEVKPNAAHYAIADLEKEYSVTVITQNVDNLHERAGSTKVLHLHGEATKVRPEDGEYDRTYSEKEVIDIGYDEVHLRGGRPEHREGYRHRLRRRHNVDRRHISERLPRRWSLPLRLQRSSDLSHRPRGCRHLRSTHHPHPRSRHQGNGNVP